MSFTKQALSPDHMQNKDLVSVMAVADATGRFHNLTVTRSPEFLWPTATFRVVSQLLDMAEDSLDKLRRSDGAFQCDVIGNSIQIAQCRLRPDYLSHRARRFLA